MPVKAKFDHIHIGVSNLDRSLEFYGKPLGLKTVKTTDAIGKVDLDAGKLDLDQIPIEKLD